MTRWCSMKSNSIAKDRVALAKRASRDILPCQTEAMPFDGQARKGRCLPRRPIERLLSFGHSQALLGTLGELAM